MNFPSDRLNNQSEKEVQKLLEGTMETHHKLWLDQQISFLFKQSPFYTWLEKREK